MKLLLKTLLLAGLLPASLLATEYPTDPTAKGRAIAEAADRRDEGWGDWSALARMELRNAQGQTSSREMRFQALEQQQDGDKRLIVFDQPRDVKGTAFLAFTKAVGNDDQWLYLPALKRVKRISSSNKSGPFVGSEFAYEDLSSQEVEKYTYQFLRDEEVDGMMTHVIERVPVDKNSGYTRQVAWIDQTEFRNVRTDYYDRKGELLKTFTAHGFEAYGENFWRAEKFVMANHQTGKTTELHWRDYAFTAGLKERQFSQSALKNSR